MQTPLLLLLPFLISLGLRYACCELKDKLKRLRTGSRVLWEAEEQYILVRRYS